ncbi:MAG: hypothetical protein EZS28_016475 [Streblomastix strix]|uniref:Uncharacterized protein n=1 Tax=Streblomastix strix TaxID=222440 RepID=A0A5J4W0E9_9EUKA|nr:MAG: hypothetical protein EZS28_016475 [Streblomastix strix]
MLSPTITEQEPQFEKKIEVDVVAQIYPFQHPFQQLVIRCETPPLSAKHRSSIFEEILTFDSSICRWLLSIISEDEHMVKESANFVLSENQLIQIVAYTFDVPESQVQIDIQDDGSCGSGAPQPYNRNEIDQMFDEKLNISDQIDTFTKQEDDVLLLLTADKTELIEIQSKFEADVLLDDNLNISVQNDAYTKEQDEALLLLKANKTELIDTYTKTEVYALLDDKLNVSNQIDANTKSQDVALLLLKADMIQLIDAQTKTESIIQLNSKANTGDFYTKGQDDALLLLNADKTELIDAYNKTKVDTILDDKLNVSDQFNSYNQIETDQLISQIDVGDVDLTDYYNKTKTDELLSEKADTTELSNYMTLGTSQTITANKTFNNACRFVSSIDGMATITGSQFVKSGADDTVVLLGAGGTKLISEFAGAPTDLSNYYTKTQTYSKTETDNKFVRLEGSIQQTITGRLKYVSPFGQTYDETQDPVANTYLTMSEVDSKLTNYDNTVNNQEINGTKTFNSNVTAAGFAKTGKDDTSVLLAGCGENLISSLGGVQMEDIADLIVSFNLNISNSKAPIALPSITIPISLATKQKTLTGVLSFRDIRISTDSTDAWGINDDVSLQFSWML